jgi:hypothetical protein
MMIRKERIEKLIRSKLLTTALLDYEEEKDRQAYKG